MVKALWFRLIVSELNQVKKRLKELHRTDYPGVLKLEYWQNRMEEIQSNIKDGSPSHISIEEEVKAIA